MALADPMNVKLSGLGTFVHACRADVMGPIKATVGIFDADLCLYGSDFPIEKLWTNYGTLYRTFRASIAHLGEGSSTPSSTAQRRASTGFEPGAAAKFAGTLVTTHELPFSLSGMCDISMSIPIRWRRSRRGT